MGAEVIVIVVSSSVVTASAGVVVLIYNHTPEWNSAEVVEKATAPNTFWYKLQRLLNAKRSADPRYRPTSSQESDLTHGFAGDDVIKMGDFTSEELQTGGHPDLQTSADVRSPYGSSIVGEDGRIRLPGSARANAISGK
jgi:hypothetical protein